MRKRGTRFRPSSPCSANCPPRVLEGSLITADALHRYQCRAPKQYCASQLLQSIPDHWSASEKRTHYRRAVSLDEGASRISGRSGAYVMASPRNLLLGPMELQQHHGKTQTRTFPGWRRQLTNGQKIQLILRPL